MDSQAAVIRNQNWINIIREWTASGMTKRDFVNVKPEASRQRSQALLKFSFRWTSSEVARSLKNSRLYQSFS